ncbi:MAG: hypothetical protein K0R38_6922 [Polyangiaceae bacterium]|nr:hypothetical protein [Polyangiaceae bacterium]
MAARRPTGRTEPTITIGKRLAERIRANVTSGVAESREIRVRAGRRAVEGTTDMLECAQTLPSDTHVGTRQRLRIATSHRGHARRDVDELVVGEFTSIAQAPTHLVRKNIPA